MYDRRFNREARVQAQGDLRMVAGDSAPGTGVPGRLRKGVRIPEEGYRDKRRVCWFVMSDAKQNVIEFLLRPSEERFRSMADNVPALIWMSGKDRLATWFNKSWLDFVGRSLEQEIGNGWIENVHPDDLSDCLRMRTQDFKGGQPFTMDYRLRRHDGEYRWIRDTGMPLFESTGMVAGCVDSCTDITEFKRDEEKLRKLLETTGVIPWEASADRWEFTYVGLQAVQLLGYPLEQWHEKGFWVAHLHPEDREGAIEFCRKSSDTCTDFAFEYRMIASNGEIVWLHDTVNCERVHGVVEQLRGFLVDITSRKEAETALRRSRTELRELTAKLITAADDEARRIARELHDDFGQRLALLNMEVSEVERLLSWQPDLAKILRQIAKEISDVAEATQHLARRLHPAILSQLGLVAALENECATFSKVHGVTVTFSAENVSDVMSDAVSLCLYRVAQEALQNLRKYSRASTASVELVGGTDEIVMAIRDSGKGFDPHAVREKGGLGFVSMEERVRLLKGKLSVRSSPGEGTQVEVRIPLSAESRGGAPSAQLD